MFWMADNPLASQRYADLRRQAMAERLVLAADRSREDPPARRARHASPRRWIGTVLVQIGRRLEAIGEQVSGRQVRTPVEGLR